VDLFLFYICGTTFYEPQQIITPIFITLWFTLYFQLIFASIQAKPPVSHIISSFSTVSSITYAHQKVLAWPLQFLSFQRQGVECGGKQDNGDSKWRQGATQKTIRCHWQKLYLRDDSAQLNVSSFLYSTLASKRSLLIHLERFIKITHQLSRDLHTSQGLSVWQSSWHLWSPLQRNILRSWIVSRTLVLTNPSHLTPTQRRYISQSGHFMFICLWVHGLLVASLPVKGISVTVTAEQPSRK